jgi:hypothetical protein
MAARTNREFDHVALLIVVLGLLPGLAEICPASPVVPAIHFRLLANAPSGPSSRLQRQGCTHLGCERGLCDLAQRVPVERGDHMDLLGDLVPG